jgi:Zn-dependent peptidase ImmA (M78 family)
MDKFGGRRFMGKPLTIQEDDERKIDQLKQYFGAPSKIAVLRMALALLEQEQIRLEKAKQWKRAVEVVRESSSATNKEMRRGAAIGKRVP